MAFPTGAQNGDFYFSKHGTRYIYYSDTSRWVKYGLELQGEIGASVQGAQGLTGAVGLTGEVGITGSQGETGTQGPTGASSYGETGPSGLSGITGMSGVTGQRQGVTGTLSLSVEASVGGSIQTGLRGILRFEHDVNIAEWDLIAEETGSVNTYVEKSTYADWPTTTPLSGSPTGPTLDLQIKNSGTTADWQSSSVSADDYLLLQIASVTGISGLTLSINYYEMDS